jgi:hypothetical protein
MARMVGTARRLDDVDRKHLASRLARSHCMI